MKRKLLVILFVMIAGLGFSQTAVNFNCNDCAGTNHDLFTELNAGKVVVLVWVMPCSACISPARTAYDDVQAYSTTYPGRVFYYLVDDLGDTPCNTITTWGNTNAMPGAVKFSNTLINPADYGNVGMPKIIILGGLSHTVFYNEDDGLNLAGINPAIDLALAATGIMENSNTVSSLNIFLNADKDATIVYDLNKTNAVNINISDITGNSLKSLSYASQASGKHELQVDLADLSQGLYILKLSTGDVTKVVKFAITN